MMWISPEMKARAEDYRRRALKTARTASFLAIIVAIFVLMVVAVIVREVFSLAFSGGQPPQASPVVVAEVTQLAFADTITAVGTARANESVAVTSKISDTISRVAFDSGQFVTGGQVLAELVDAEEAAGLEAARATLGEARRERDRVAALARRGVAPAQRRDEAESNFQRAAAQVSAIEARMAERIIRAPFDGVVGLRNISAGELIGTGTVIATLNDVSVIKLDFAVPERFLSSLAAGQRVQARASAWPDQVFAGIVTQIDNQVDPVSRTVTVRAELPNGDGRLVPGMLMRVEVRRGERNMPGVPESAMMRLADQAYVFVIDEGEAEGEAIARRRDVEPGLRVAGYIEILGGLERGERVIVDGTHRTRDGGAVRITGERAVPPAALLPAAQADLGADITRTPHTALPDTAEASPETHNLPPGTGEAPPVIRRATGILLPDTRPLPETINWPEPAGTEGVQADAEEVSAGTPALTGPAVGGGAE